MERPRSVFRALLGLVLLCWVASATGQEVFLATIAEKHGPPPERVVDGASDARFQQVTGNELTAAGRGPYWWRVTFNRALSEKDDPQLVLEWPQRRTVELWAPGSKSPIRRSVYGPDADLTHTPRVLSFALGKSVKPGDVVYLRVSSVNLTGSVVVLQSHAELLKEEIHYAQVRSVQMTILGFIAFVACCLFVSLRERGYAYLSVTLLLQMIGLMAEGGELRGWSLLSELAMDSRTNIVLNTAAVLASVRFLIFFLGLRQRQRRLTRVLDVCSALLGGLLVVSLIAVWRSSALFGNMVLLVVVVSVAAAILIALLKKQREAIFLLLAWTPMLVVITSRIGALHQWWPTADWMEYGYSNAMTVGGIGLLVGLADKLHQLRRDRDSARHRATFDPLTRLMTRAAMIEALEAAVISAHARQAPLSIVFFDVDHFKLINDQHGHMAGDDVLRVIGDETRKRSRASDLLGRFGGDEIVVALLDTHAAGAVRFAESLREILAAVEMPDDRRPIKIGISVGVAELRPAETVAELLERADSALYASKNAGRGRVTDVAMMTEGEAA